ncbi:MAG: SPFH domain-containing protein [Marinibacterium sp.]|nr:SPFH domain-containing protein [Marinibacterium sp.]
MLFETLVLFVIGVLALILFFGLVLGRLYKRATREVSLVKTGAGGKRVIMDGAILVIPLLHEVSPVNMKTLRLEVKRENDAALITQDRMRVDVGVEFYVSVSATDEGIARAAQTLGDRTFYVDQLREMIEGKLVDGLRAVAAQMTMDGLHENRADFVQEVQNAVSEDLLKNGLSLESVSLTALDQTPFEALDENNAFNAVGMRKLAEVIADSKKERAQIDADAEVSVRRAAMEAERQRLTIEQDEQAAQIEQAKIVANLRAEQEADIARQRELADQESEKARVSREQAIRAAEIARDRELEVAEQERQIIIAQKSEEESRARASADLARAEATKAMEAVTTAREVAEAERQKQIALIEAAREAEREATKVRLSAAADRDAAADRAAARREEAQAEADAVSIRAEAKQKDMLAEAEGKRAIVAAENALSADLIDMKVSLARIEAMPGIVAEMVRPAEKIESIKIHHVAGIGGASAGGSGGSGGSAAGDKPAINQALDSILDMAVQLPALKKLGDELGLSMEDGVSGVIAGVLPDDTKSAPQDPRA